MSYDLTIFFPHPEFPVRAWCELLESFRGQDCEIRFEDGAEEGCPTNCSIIVDHSVIGIGVVAEESLSRSRCAPANARWGAYISTTMGRSWRAWFIQHAVAYHALVFFPGVTVHDCQYHYGRSLDASSWSTPESWHALAERRLWSLGPKEELIELGLFHPDGRLRF